MVKVYDSGGECLGEEWINLLDLQNDTKQAIIHLIYLDKIMYLYTNFRHIPLEEGRDPHPNW